MRDLTAHSGSLSEKHARCEKPPRQLMVPVCPHDAHLDCSWTACGLAAARRSSHSARTWRTQCSIDRVAETWASWNSNCKQMFDFRAFRLKKNGALQLVYWFGLVHMQQLRLHFITPGRSLKCVHVYSAVLRTALLIQDKTLECVSPPPPPVNRWSSYDVLLVRLKRCLLIFPYCETVLWY